MQRTTTQHELAWVASEERSTSRPGRRLFPVNLQGEQTDGNQLAPNRISNANAAGHRQHPFVSVVIPTLNEAQNIGRAIARVSEVLCETAHEIIVVDDQSSDSTVAVASALIDEFPQLRVISREKPDCLTGAILSGFSVACGDILAVVDADLQHDVRVLPFMCRATASADVVVGSRYCEGGGSAGWSLLRHFSSRVTALVSRAATGIPLKDPLSGFFCIRRVSLRRVSDRIPRRGWKILLELVGQSDALRIREVPYSFAPRSLGKSKMSSRVVVEWAKQVFRLAIGRLLGRERHTLEVTLVGQQDRLVL